MRDNKDIDKIEQMIHHIDIIYDNMKHIKGVEDFEAETPYSDACLFRLGQIGEIARDDVLKDINKNNPQVPWKAWRGIRNIIDHGYDSSNFSYDMIWETLNVDVPELYKELQLILTSLKNRNNGESGGAS